MLLSETSFYPLDSRDAGRLSTNLVICLYAEGFSYSQGPPFAPVGLQRHPS